MVNLLSRIFSPNRQSSSLDEILKRPPLPPRKSVVQNSQLLSLPDEVLVHIISCIQQESLPIVRLVCSHFSDLAQPFIFENYDVFRGERATHLAALLLLDTRRAKWLRSVRVSTKHEEDEGLTNFPHCLSIMQNLRTLVLETPDCNAKAAAYRVRWIRLQQAYEAVFKQSTLAIPPQERLLQRLESCTIHFVDDFVSLYPLTKYSNIFVHPTLKTLTLSCASTDFPHALLREYRQYKKSTALEHLHLEECDLHPESLELLLKFPRALKSLKISEGVRYNEEMSSRRSRLHGNLNPGLLSRALKNSVAETLESLSLSLGYRRSRGESINSPNRALNLTSLAKLKELDVSMSTLGLIITRPKCDHLTYSRLPASLEHMRIFSIPLIVFRGRSPMPLRSCVYNDKVRHGVPNLQQVTYCYEYQAIRGNADIGRLFRNGGEETLTRLISAAERRVLNVNNKKYPAYVHSDTRVVVESYITPSGFIPPYLLTEEKPVKQIIWDTADPTAEALRWEASARDENGDLDATAWTAQGPVEPDSGDDEALSWMPAEPHAAELLALLIQQNNQAFQF